MLFILGYPRSGTTLLRAMLSQHSAIHLVNEPELFFAFHHAGILHQDEVHLNENHVHRFREIGLCQRHLDSLAADLIPSISSQGPVALCELYKRLLGISSPAKVIGDKSINNLFFVERIRALFPNSHFVWLVRDPRAAVGSRIRKDASKHSTSEEFAPWKTKIGAVMRLAQLWRRWHEFGWRYRESEDLSIIKFEELVTHPHTTLEAICAKVGLAFEPTMLDADGRSTDPVFGSDGAYAHQNLRKDVMPQRAQGYKDMPAPLVCLVERICASQMVHFDYSVTQPKLSFLDRTALRIHFLRRQGEVQRKVQATMRQRGVDG